MGCEGDEETPGPPSDPQDGGGRGHLKTFTALRQEVKVTLPSPDLQDRGGGTPRTPQDWVGGG